MVGKNAVEYGDVDIQVCYCNIQQSGALLAARCSLQHMMSPSVTWKGCWVVAELLCYAQCTPVGEITSSDHYDEVLCFCVRLGTASHP